MKYIDVENTKNCAWIYLNRPEASNAFTVEMIDELIDAVQKADYDSQIRCIVLSGRGEHFCAGGDVKNMLNKSEMFEGESNELRERYIRGIQKIPKAFSQVATPMIAMINGAAIGAGLDMSCMCDIRICSENAKFGETFTKLGLIPGDGGTYFLQRIVGFAKAMEMTLTANIYSALEAKEMGLVNQVTNVDMLKTICQEYVDKICLNAPIANQMAKRAIEHAYRSDLSSNLELLAAFQGITQRTSDHFEALNSFKQKSKSNFAHK
jgi:2-(1,2-epoxy-1,2-dihydrophenyl)acetyl-CoA isomerase